MTLNDLTVNFSHLDRTTILEDWRWLIGTSKLPILITASGDAFVQDVNDGGVFALDTTAGKLDRVADTFDAFQALLADKSFVIERFAVQMVGALLSAGSVLAPGQVYSFKIPPALGGEHSIDNIEAVDMQVHFSVSGQILEQIFGLPPGTPITDVTIS